MQLDIEINNATQAFVRVNYSPGTPDARDEPGDPPELEIVDAWHGSNKADAMEALDAFGIDILSLYEAKIDAAYAAEAAEESNALAALINSELG